MVPPSADRDVMFIKVSAVSHPNGRGETHAGSSSASQAGSGPAASDVLRLRTEPQPGRASKANIIGITRSMLRAADFANDLAFADGRWQTWGGGNNCLSVMWNQIGVDGLVAKNYNSVIDFYILSNVKLTKYHETKIDLHYYNF